MTVADLPGLESRRRVLHHLAFFFECHFIWHFTYLCSLAVTILNFFV